MKCLFVFNENLTEQQINQQYGLILALLNFEYDLQIVFDAQIFKEWLKKSTTSKKLRALQIYGVDAFLLLNTSTNDWSNNLNVSQINHNDFMTLKLESDFIS